MHTELLITHHYQQNNRTECPCWPCKSDAAPGNGQVCSMTARICQLYRCTPHSLNELAASGTCGRQWVSALRYFRLTLQLLQAPQTLQKFRIKPCRPRVVKGVLKGFQLHEMVCCICDCWPAQYARQDIEGHNELRGHICYLLHCAV